MEPMFLEAPHSTKQVRSCTIPGTALEQFWTGSPLHAEVPFRGGLASGLLQSEKPFKLSAAVLRPDLFVFLSSERLIGAWIRNNERKSQ
jgi:hypothetical protein